ncbi:MAG: hypothetical protein JSV49_07040 [Thermoplasmata archaeon]|nr:MAG: hypothetical protein JSV49_07040 [Thermoplasmata archaeon]
MDNFEIVLRIGVMGFALLLFIVLTIAYINVKNPKLMYACLAFLIFFIKGIMFTLGIFYVYFYKLFPTTFELVLLDFFILVVLYLGIARK